MNRFDSRPAPLDRGAAPAAQLLARMLDEIDYGLLLVSADAQLRYANGLARLEVTGMGRLQLVQGRLVALEGLEQAALRSAVANAALGRRSLLTVGLNGQALSLAVIPMPAGDEPDDGAEPLALLVFNRPQHCAELTVEFFARSQRLTGAESRVLLRLCQGSKPNDIARQQGVAISTVRTQIGSIRDKTRSTSIQDLIRRVADLPPFAPALKPVAIGWELHDEPAWKRGQWAPQPEAQAAC